MKDKIVCKHGLYLEFCWCCPTAELIAKDLIKDITSKPPDTWDNLSESINILTTLIKEYPYMWTPVITNWIHQANEILRDLDDKDNIPCVCCGKDWKFVPIWGYGGPWCMTCLTVSTWNDDYKKKRKIPLTLEETRKRRLKMDFEYEDVD